MVAWGAKAPMEPCTAIANAGIACSSGRAPCLRLIQRYPKKLAWMCIDTFKRVWGYLSTRATRGIVSSWVGKTDVEDLGSQSVMFFPKDLDSISDTEKATKWSKCIYGRTVHDYNILQQLSARMCSIFLCQPILRWIWELPWTAKFRIHLASCHNKWLGIFQPEEVSRVQPSKTFGTFVSLVFLKTCSGCLVTKPVQSWSLKPWNLRDELIDSDWC